jgi:hypothetical protein
MHSRRVHRRPAASFDEAAGRLSDGAALAWLVFLAAMLGAVVWALCVFLTP